MLPYFSETQVRIIGCLMEKSVTTPSQYPPTLNALTNACNQKSARHPVLSLTPAEVGGAARALKEKSLLQIEENFKTGIEKYKQRLCNTAFSDFKFHASEFAIVCLLLLRGPQTPGELRAHSGRLYTFADNDAVVAAACGLMSEDADNSLIVQLPRTPGRKDAEYMHQLCGVVDTAAYAKAAADDRADAGATQARVTKLEQRVRELEAENAALRQRLSV